MEREAKGLLDRNRFVCVKGLGVQRNSPFFQFLIGSKKDLLAAVKYTHLTVDAPRFVLFFVVLHNSHKNKN